MAGHLDYSGRGRILRYRYPRPVSSAPSARPTRNRQEHGRQLLEAFQSIQQQLTGDYDAHGRSADFGVQLEFTGALGYALALDSLDLRSSGIELVNTREEVLSGDGPEVARMRIHATVFVPYTKISLFVRKVEAYLTQQAYYTDRRTRERRDVGPKNAALVESISYVRRAVLSSFWTDGGVFPPSPEARWWEVWLRAPADEPRSDRIENAFRQLAAAAGLRVRDGTQFFPEQTVVIVFGTAEQLGSSLDLLNCLAELRNPATTAGFYTRLSQQEANELVSSIRSRVQWPPPGSPAVCVLDTGVNRGHELLAPAIPAHHLDAYDRTWGLDDHHPQGHGTAMAGLALHGDLVDVAQNTNPIVLDHGLESVKILPRVGENEPQLYGLITQESMSRAEINAPNRNRVFALAITALEGRNSGKPSAWSSALDQSTFGEGSGGHDQKLVMVSAGNTTRDDASAPADYPNSNRRFAIHNPAQAWNSICVGAFTSKTGQPRDLRGFTPIAETNGIGPTSSTSVIWDNEWPIKPDIVCEGGNWARDTTGNLDCPDELQLLTTNAAFQRFPIAAFGDTSAATALAARMGARLFARYPTYWPETIRGLMIHSAHWTTRMLDGRDPFTLSELERRDLLRTVGYGVPDFERASNSAANRVTLVCQDVVQPFEEIVGHGDRTKDFMLHPLPWPQEILRGLLDTETNLRVTLSYFIEPNPGPRDASSKFRYASAGLRFDLKRATESTEVFCARTSSSSEIGPMVAGTGASETGRWLIGRLRERGSIHHDVWRGRAADLAGRDAIAVYPVTGWWRYRKFLGKTNSRLRYSLIVSIETPPEAPEIYTPIAESIRIPVPIVIPTSSTAN